MPTTPRPWAALCFSTLLALFLVPSISSAQTGLVAAYSFSEGSGTTIGDASGNGNDGVMAGASWTSAGRFGSALEFDGIDDLATVADSESLRLVGPMTIEAWVYPTRRTRSVILVKELESGVAYALYAIDNGLRPSARITTTRDGERTAGSDITLPLATWTHVAATHDGAVLRFYIGGVQVASRSVDGQIRTSADALRIGGRIGRDAFAGRIDEVRIYSRSLSAAEIRASMNAAPEDTVVPAVAITSPSDGTTIGGTILVAANASDDVGVAGVRFLIDDVPFGAEDLTAPYGITWNTALASPGSHSLTAIARDAAGNETTSASVTVLVANDTTPPVVAIASPAAGGTVSGVVTISANASDDVGVAGVQFLLDGVAFGAEDSSAPYSVAWNTALSSVGTHTVSAQARDAAGNVATSAPVTVTIASDTTPPTVTIVSPGGGTVSGTVTISASAFDNVGVAGVQFLLDGVAFGAEDTVAPYGIAWNTTLSTAGTHTVSARARDAAGNISTAVAVTVIVSNDTTAPFVAISAPLAGSTVSGVVTISAGASDNVGVVGVQFLLDGAAFGAEDTLAPYSISWDTNLSSAGTHTVSARARDAAGNMATAAVVSVTVSNSSIEAQIGSWSAPVDLGLVMVHATLLHTNKVLMWRGETEGGSSATVWDPNTGALIPVPNSFSNLFCSGHTALPDGTIFVAGGHDNANGILGSADANLFDPLSLTWRGLAPMAHRRWYPTTTMLSDGRVLVTSGADGCLTCFVDVPELYDPATNQWTQLTAASLNVPLYPFMFVLPDGRLLNAGTSEKPFGTRTLDVASQTWTTVDPTIVDGGSAVMYAPGKVLKSGSAGTSGDSGFAAATAYTLDMTAAVPAWQQVASMAFPRAYHNLVMLPDGNVLAVGGGRTLDGTNPSQGVLEAELWSPITRTWRTVARMQVPRMYHETALLLPDGRVLVGGSGDDFGGAPEQTTIEIYSPPYLFRGSRPAISGAPSTIAYGSEFGLFYTNASQLSSVVLVRPASVTHQFDQNQRFISLPFRIGEGGLTVTAPANTNVAPPGYYMLFIVDGNGVPSVAAFVRLPAPADDAQPPTAPTLTAFGMRSAVSLSWSASTDSTGIAAYNVHRSTVSGFVPSGINRVARTTATSITDSGLLPGTYFYVVTAEDLRGNVSNPSNQVSATATADTVAPAISITQPVDGATVSGFTPLSATASDDVFVVGVQFLIDGVPLEIEDNSAPYSVMWGSSAVPNGVHVVTAIARDGAGNRTTSLPVTITVANTAPAPVGLIAAYGFDEGVGSTLSDVSGSGNAGTISGATWTVGHSGGALSFDGIDDWVTVNDAASLDLTTGMTIEAWVNPSVLGSWRTVVLKETIGGLAYALYGSDDFSLPSGFIRIAQDIGATGGASLPLNTWTHLAATYDGSTLRLFVNGIEDSATPVGGTIAQSAAPLRIGGNAVWGEFFTGRIDDVRIYKRALTAAEIQTDMGTPVR